MAHKNKTPTQLANDFIDYFILKYSQKYKKRIILNRYQSKFQVVDLLRDFSYDDLITMLDYYFELNASHSIYDFVIGYHQISELKFETDEDAEQRRKAKEATRLRVEKYRQENMNE